MSDVTTGEERTFIDINCNYHAINLMFLEQNRIRQTTPEDPSLFSYTMQTSVVMFASQ